VPFIFAVVVVANEAVVANVVPALAVSVATTWTVLVPVPPEVSVLNEMLMIVVLIECQQYAKGIVFKKTYIRAGPGF
jgi:hypothetical protein